jgi:hypothetical protein
MKRYLRISVLGGVVGSLPLALALGASAAGSDIGQVVSLSGQVDVQGSDGATRRLACSDVIRQGDRVITPVNGQVGILAGDVLAQLDAQSRARFGLTAEGGLELGLESGHLRVVDTEADGPAALLSTPHGSTAAAGGEADLYAAPDQSNLCAWERSLEVAGTAGNRLSAAPGQCVTVKRSGDLSASPAERQGIVGASQSCFGRIVAVGALFSPTDVAAPFPAAGLGAPGDPGTRIRSSCDDPGGVCPGLPDIIPIRVIRDTPRGGGGLIIADDPVPDPYPGDNPQGPVVDPY